MEAAAWAKTHTTVHKVLRNKPTATSATLSVGQRCDNAFVIVADTASLSIVKDVAALKAVVITDAAGKRVGVIDGSDIAHHLLECAERDGLVEPSAHCMNDLLKLPAAKRFCEVSVDMAYGGLEQLFKKGNARCVLAIEADGTLRGVINESHRRY